MNKVKPLILFISLLPVHTCWSQSWPPCDVGARVRCDTPPAATVSQAPLGALNGRNATFALPSAPDQRAGVHVFLNGIIQPYGASYNRVGSSIVFNHDRIPQSGDSLIVSYTPLPGRHSRSEERIYEPDWESASGFADIGTAAIKDALQDETKRVLNASTSHQEASGNSYLSSRAFELLSSKLTAPDSASKTPREASHKKSRRRSKEQNGQPGDVDGVEGLGDKEQDVTDDDRSHALKLLDKQLKTGDTGVHP